MPDETEPAKPFHGGVIHIPLEVLLDALLLPEETTLVPEQTRYDVNGRLLRIGIEHPSLPEVPVGAMMPQLEIGYRMLTRQERQFTGFWVRDYNVSFLEVKHAE